MDSPRAGEQVHTMNQPATTATAKSAAALDDATLSTISVGTFGLMGILEKIRPKQARP